MRNSKNKQQLIKTILATQRLKDLANTPVPRLRKKEMNDNLQIINVFRQNNIDILSKEGQKQLTEDVPGLNNQIVRNRFEAVEIISRNLLDMLINEGAKRHILSEGRITERKQIRITPKTPKLRR